MKTIQLRNGQKMFFTSDTHFGHSNLCRATTKWKNADRVTRDFKSLEAMNDLILKNINDVVGVNDILIHLGDFSFGGIENIAKFRLQIKCKNIYLIHGNHDHHIENNIDVPGFYFGDDNNIYEILDGNVDKGDIFPITTQDLFIDTFPYLELSVDTAKNTKNKKFILFHYPITSWKDLNKDVMHLFGHVHLGKEQRFCGGKSMDVGVEGNDFKPYELSEVLELIEGREIDRLSLPKDHHSERLD